MSLESFGTWGWLVRGLVLFHCLGRGARGLRKVIGEQHGWRGGKV